MNHEHTPEKKETVETTTETTQTVEQQNGGLTPSKVTEHTEVHTEEKPQPEKTTETHTHETVTEPVKPE